MRTYDTRGPICPHCDCELFDLPNVITEDKSVITCPECGKPFVVYAQTTTEFIGEPFDANDLVSRSNNG